MRFNVGGRRVVEDLAQRVVVMVAQVLWLRRRNARSRLSRGSLPLHTIITVASHAMRSAGLFWQQPIIDTPLQNGGRGVDRWRPGGAGSVADLRGWPRGDRLRPDEPPSHIAPPLTQPPRAAPPRPQPPHHPLTASPP